MSLFRGIQEYIALDANNIALVFDSGNIVSISGNIFLYPPQGHPILYKYSVKHTISDLLLEKLNRSWSAFCITCIHVFMRVYTFGHCI